MILLLRKSDSIGIEKLNSYEIRTKKAEAFFHSHKFIIKTEIICISDLKLKTVKGFTGCISTTIKQLKIALRTQNDIYLQIHDNLIMLNDEEMPFTKTFFVQENKLYESPDHLLLEMPKISLPALKFNLMCFEKLKRLILIDISIEQINITNLTKLKYLRINNCLMKRIIYTNKHLDYCNLSNNRLRECNITARVLILKNNNIERYKSMVKCNMIDLSNNNLVEVECSTNYLKICKSNLNHKINLNAYKINADYSNNINIGDCPNLKVLSINGCHMNQILFPLNDLIIFKASDNNFHVLPPLEKCIHADLSNNYLSEIDGKHLVSLNISKNDLSVFNINNYPNMKYMDIRFNDIEYLQGSHNKIRIISNTPIRNIKNCRNFIHKCKNLGQIYLFKLVTRFSNTYITFFLHIKTNLKNSKVLENIVSEILNKAINNYTNETSFFKLLNNLSNEVSLYISKRAGLCTFIFTLITNKWLMIRCMGMEAIVHHFANTTKLTNTEIHIFVNTSFWLVIPLVCNMNLTVSFKKWNFLGHEHLPLKVFKYLNLFCPISAEFMIMNSKEYMEHRNFTSEILLLNHTCLRNNSLIFEKVISDKANILRNDSVSTLGFQNLDFGVCRITPRQFLRAIDIPVFVFMKVRKGFTLEHNEYNLHSVLDFYCKIFGGVLIEKGYKVYIVGFNDSLSAAFWSVRVQKSILSIGIDLSIGIAEGVVFETEEDGILSYGGPVFHKLSRMADLGTGIFCDASVVINHPYLIKSNQGDRFLKGFRDKSRIYSIELLKGIY